MPKSEGVEYRTINTKCRTLVKTLSKTATSVAKTVKTIAGQPFAWQISEENHHTSQYNMLGAMGDLPMKISRMTIYCIVWD